MHTDNEDTNDRSVSSPTPSDDDLDKTCSHAHRSCGRDGSCTSVHHQQPLAACPTEPALSNGASPVKGDIRPAENEPGRQQKYDGTRWRRICCVPDCKTYLNGGVFFENWLCRKHYLLTISNDGLGDTNYSPIRSKPVAVPRPPKPPKVVNRKLSRDYESHKRGDLKVDADGSHQKYDGRAWRPVCTYDNCISFVVRHGYCQRHYLEVYKKGPKTHAPPTDAAPRPFQTKSQIVRAKNAPILQPKRGEIQTIRQLWNGTKWYSLCHYYTGECTRRSGGKKHGFLCDLHHRESVARQKNPVFVDPDDHILISPTVKRKKLINEEPSLSSIYIDGSSSLTFPPAPSRTDEKQCVEQCIQTDVTCPLESRDLRGGCILIADDDDERDPYPSEPCPMIVNLKKEEDYIITKRKAPNHTNLVPFECKIELAKLEV